MTEPNPTYSEMLAEFKRTTAAWERREKLRYRLARWFLVPYCSACVTVGLCVVKVFEAGLFTIGVALAAGYGVLVFLPWAAPILLRRSEIGESKR